MCPIFVCSVYNFGRSDDVISDEMPTKPIIAPPMVIHIDEHKLPKHIPYVAPRNRPQAIEELAHKDVLRLIKIGVLVKATEPPLLVHPGMHILKSDGRLRFIIDFSQQFHGHGERRVGRCASFGSAFRQRGGMRASFASSGLTSASTQQLSSIDASLSYRSRRRLSGRYCSILLLLCIVASV